MDTAIEKLEPYGMFKQAIFRMSTGIPLRVKS